MDWIDISKQKPENGNDVLVFYKTETGRKVILLAAYYGTHELESNDDAFGDDLDYNEEKDEYYAPEGWYESCEHHEEYGYMYITGVEITHWMPLPEPPQPH